MVNFIAVFIGGGIGSIFRYLMSMVLFRFMPQFPLATLISNGLSSFIAGIIIGLGMVRFEISSSSRLFLITGFCGGFSTFSTFSVETVHLFNSGKILPASANVALNLFICFSLVMAGLAVTRKI